MESEDHNAEERNVGTAVWQTVDERADEKAKAMHAETEDFHGTAERGHAATDRYGQSLVTFDVAAEAKLRRKIDFCIVPIVSIMYLFTFMDRANIGNAKLAGFERDLHLAGYDYNTINSIFSISYILFELPSSMVCKWVGPGWFIPTTALCLGVCSLCTAFVHNFSQACAVRFLLGIFESGVLPSIAYYLSRWYRRSELVFRLSLYVVMAPLAGAFGGLLASAILQLDSFGSLYRWRMIFAIEGTITCGIALVAYVILTDRPETARWLTQEEKDLAISRVKSERIATTEILDRFDTKKILRGIFSPVTLTTATIFLLDNVTVQGMVFFAPTIVMTIYPHESVVSQQLHTVPPYMVGAFFVLLFSFLSWRFDRRNIFFILSAPMIVTGYIIFVATLDPHARYGATFLIAAGGFSFGALTSAQVAANVVSDTARSTAIGTVHIMGNSGGLISTWSFLPTDSPRYNIGNGLNLGTSSMVLILALGLQYYMWADNKRRKKRNVDAELQGLSIQQIQDLDWHHPGFRWSP
ncbi:uncharacterized protein Z518_05486 [Rhinocladiella mackenziei CBS 650.93]|uniref:Major facilitator superfamily (MFS) profile domain-containing protein n=1 Tax=Rhinocladiella mackenziei CBS 650.93 TaxID=1442369 RepID=A0A0D2INB4_9EURO|nr:uncharacterized protein Z518_05486 [Rhinocladiella mackenziei CBS 650.93]KIX04616.1 hypothetical protein Z518_05486 [Rhinocladiella mackenziei CBS 650.93]